MSKIWNKDDLTWGFEFEVSNVLKSTTIPSNLGKWEYCESDIINTKGKYKNICADPLGINPPVGGEINTKPTNTREEQVNRVSELINLFKSNGEEPDCGITAHSHIHVHIKNIENNVDALKRLILFTYNNQEFFFEKVYKYNEKIIPKGLSKINNYLKNDGARKIPEWLVLNIIEKAQTVDEIIKLFTRGIDGMVAARPVRYGVNFYSLKNCKTIEFRCFRGTVDLQELSDCFEIVEQFVLSGLNGVESVGKIINSKQWNFPDMQFDLGQYQGWIDTKHCVELVKNKNREFWEVENIKIMEENIQELQINPVSREEFVNSITPSKEDSFAKTFLSKCDMMNLWDLCFGLFDNNGELCSAIVFTISKTNPKTANLQLIHTFNKHRRKGYGKKITLEMLSIILPEVEYLRVSAEQTAVDFYKSIGFEFLGKQKSGTLLSMCKVTSQNVKKCKFDKNDRYINNCLNRRGKGGCVEIF